MVIAGVGAASAAVTPLPVNVDVDYQLGGASAVPPGVGVVARDRTEPSARGVYGICYINAFQTQPGTLTWWRRHHPDLLLRRKGREVRDPDWPDEVLLDITTSARRARLARVWRGWAVGCARAGYAAMEGDNLDTWTRSHGAIRRAHAVDAARRLRDVAHAAGLAVGQKNAVEIAPRLARMGFDFVVVEECERYRECGRYRRAYGDRMLEIEYPDSGGRAVFERACAARGARIAIVYRDRALAPAGRPGYQRAHC